MGPDAYVFINEIYFDNLIELDLEHNQISFIEPNALIYVPELRLLNLKHNSIETISSNTLGNLTKLETLLLSYNQLKLIGSIDQLNSLRVLDLSFNSELSMIHPDVFKSCKHLRSLNISNILEADNYFHSISTAVMELEELEELVVDNNMMDYYGLLPVLPTLKILSLKNCMIISMGQILMNQTTQLEHLDLSHNILKNMYKISRASFNLKSLILNDNKITSLQIDDLKSFTELVLLDLSTNLISEIRYGSFDALKKLSILLLNHNKLKHVQFYSYTLVNLSSLNLSKNLLHSLKNASFSHLKKLKSLILSDNVIKEIERGTFSGLKKLENLNLNNNKLAEFDVNVLLGINFSI